MCWKCCACKVVPVGWHLGGKDYTEKEERRKQASLSVLKHLKAAWHSEYTAGWGDTRSYPCVPGCECAGKCHQIPYPECIWILSPSLTLPINTCRNHFCLNSAHKGKRKIAYEERSFGCYEFYLLFPDLVIFFDYSLRSTEIKRFTCSLQYAIL